MSGASPSFDRRAFLALIAAAGGVACTGGVPKWVPPSPAASGAPPSPAASGAPPTPAPERDGASAGDKRPGRFEPIKGETYPNAKRLAGRFVEELLTYGPGAKFPAVLRRALVRSGDRDFEFDRALKNAAPLFVKGAVSWGSVVYPQLGGLTLGTGPDRASVMVVVRQRLLNSTGDDIAQEFVRTVDVRLISRDDTWMIEDLASAGGEPVAPPANLPALAQRVLDDRRIELPDSARWDILRGDIDDRLLTTMLDLAGVAPFSVAVLRSGHPYNVFGTDLISSHTEGRGVDIWRVAGQPVVLQQPSKKSEAHDFTAAALKDFDVPELGSPWDLDGPPEPGKSKPSFTDAVHADHIHVAFKAA